MDAIQHFTNLALAAMVDGELADEEVRLLEQHAESMRLPEGEAQAVLNRVFSGELRDFVKPQSVEGRKAAFRAVVRILRADRKLRRPEQRMIRLLADGRATSTKPARASTSGRPM